MIDDGEATIHDAAGIIEADGQQSSHAIETCSGEASRDGLDDDPGPWTDPVGCANASRCASGRVLSTRQFASSISPWITNGFHAAKRRF